MIAPLVLTSMIALAAPADSTTCPEVFGDKAAQAYGADLAAYQVHNVVVRRGAVTIFHGVGSWRSVKIGRFSGLHVVKANGSGGIVRLGDDDEQGTCRGTFAVQVGARVGEGRVIVGTAAGGLLVATEDTLTFVQGDAPAPRFDLIWQSGYHLLGASASASGTSGLSRPRPASRAKTGKAAANPKLPVFQNPSIMNKPTSAPKMRSSVSRSNRGSAPKPGSIK